MKTVGVSYHTQALIDACGAGDTEQVRTLLPLSDPTVADNLALIKAVKNGHADVVALLLPVCDAKTNGSLALRIAVAAGHLECVRLLVGQSAPKAYGSAALALAMIYNHQECVDILWGLSNPRHALRTMSNEFEHLPNAQQAIANIQARMASEKQHNILHKRVAPAVSVPKTKKI